MNSNWKKRLIVFLFATLTLILASSTTVYGSTDLKYEDTLEMSIGDEELLCTVFDLAPKYTWTSSDPTVVSVPSGRQDYSVYATALKPGTAIITVNYYDKIIDTIEITVKSEPFTINGATESEFRIINGRFDHLEMKRGDDYVYSKDCTYQVDRPDIVSINESNTKGSSSIWIDAIAPGEAILTVTTKYGEIATCKIYVYIPITDTEVWSSKKVLYLGRGDSVKVQYKLQPSNTTEPVLFSTTSNCVTVSDEGIVKPVEVGTATINVDPLYGAYSYAGGNCIIEVKKPFISKKNHTLYRHKTVKLSMTGGKNVIWTSSDTSIATVNSEGKVTAKKSGKVKITANSGGYTSTATINVINPKLSKTSNKLFGGKSFQLKITGGVGGVKWVSSNKNVATVNSKGKVSTKKPGTATITAKVSGVELNCKVTVKAPTLAVTNKTVAEKVSFKIKINGGYGKAKWTSSNSKVVKVGTNGKLTAGKVGTATVTAKIDGKKLKCKVKVKKNQSIEKISLNVFDYDYGSPSVPLKKVYYENGKLKADVYVMNNRTFTADYFEWIRYDLWDSEGNVFASQKFYDVPIGIGEYSKKKITLTFKESSIKKHVDLTKGTSWDYDYYYRWSFD